MAAVAAEVDALEGLAARMRSPLVRWHAIRSRATLDAAQGRFAAALAAGERVIELARRSGNDGSIVPSIGFLVAVRSLVGDAGSFPEESAFLNVDQTTATGLRGMLARAHLATGDTDAAVACYRELPGIHQVPPFVRTAGRRRVDRAGGRVRRPAHGGGGLRGAAAVRGQVRLRRRRRDHHRGVRAAAAGHRRGRAGPAGRRGRPPARGGRRRSAPEPAARRGDRPLPLGQDAAAPGRRPPKPPRSPPTRSRRPRRWA